MAVEAFQKEEYLQQHVIEQWLNGCDVHNPDECRRLIGEAAKVANTDLFRIRIGSFVSKRTCVVFANLGPNNLNLLDLFRDRLARRGVSALATAIWPKLGTAGAGYTWAVMIDDGDSDTWEKEAADAWIHQG